MKQATINFAKWALGSVGRELVRIGFTLAGIHIFITHSARTPKECDSIIAGIKTNSAEIFGILLVFGTGLGVALAMKGIEWLIARLKK